MKKTGLFLCLSLLILFLSYLSNSTLTAGEGISKLPQRDNNSNTQILQELREIKTAIREGSISARDVLGIVIPVIVAMFLFWLQQYNESRDTRSRSCEAMQTELKENKESLVAEEQKRIRYHIVNLTDSTSNIKQKIDYREVYLNTDSYDSILHSGLFTHFSVESQHTLSKLYSRIKSHNDLTTYLQHFQDTFFLEDNSTARKTRWKEEKQSYEVTLTEWEVEIISLLYMSEIKVMNEKPSKILGLKWERNNNNI